MQVTRIKRIQDHRIFHDFKWPRDLPPFKRFNLIYGWNGSGKTTLSELFRHLQNRTVVTTGEVEFEIDGARTVDGIAIPDASIPGVRVFNRDVVAASILSADDGVAPPIFYFGEASVEKQKEIEQLEAELAAAETALNTERDVRKRVANELDKFAVDQARNIKRILTTSRTPKYNNYNKTSFRNTMEAFDPTTASAALLADAERERLLTEKNGQPKGELPEQAVPIPDFAELEKRTREVVTRSVVNQVLSELSSDSMLNSWVDQGLQLHSGNLRSERCRFCGQPLTAERRAALESHFNDAYAKLQEDINALALSLDSAVELISSWSPPIAASTYQHLAEEFSSVVSAAEATRADAVVHLRGLRSLVDAKSVSPLSSNEFPQPMAPQKAYSDSMAKSSEKVIEMLKKHNSTTADFQAGIDRACERLEGSYVAEEFSTFRELATAAAESNSKVAELRDRPGELRTQVRRNQRSIFEHQTPADELNDQLRSYLGRDEIRFEMRDAGYALTRAGHPESSLGESDLSEGEKTAIAFLYFLKSLQDREFDMANGIVVVDDPVSSLDTNSLFSAFGFLRERTKDCGQLFVLTHNFGFFRQVRNWLQWPKGERKHSRLLFLQNRFRTDGVRIASLEELDPLLTDYESEYHYLFKRVHEVATAPAQAGLEGYYGVPNLARRLLESFLAFRYPGISSFTGLMAEADYPAAQTSKITHFLHTNSHSDSIAESTGNLESLSETVPVVRDIMAMMKHLDKGHYDGMLRLIEASPD